MLCSGCSFPSSSPPFHVVYAFAVIVTTLFFPVNLGISVLPCVTQCNISKVTVTPLGINIILYKKNVQLVLFNLSISQCKCKGLK